MLDFMALPFCCGCCAARKPNRFPSTMGAVSRCARRKPELVQGVACGRASHFASLAQMSQESAPKLFVELLHITDAPDAPSPNRGNVAVVHYTGWLTNGTKFDSSVDRGDPFSFTVGMSEVIAGWDIAVLRMRVGDKVKLTIPPELGYGEGGYPGAIPANATLIFEVELIEVQ